MENRCKFLVIPLRAIRFSQLRNALVLALFIITGLIGSGNSALAQQLSVNGTVTDSKGEPIVGVTVLVKGTTNGTLTDGSGKYSLTNVPTDATISFSFVGLTAQDIPLNGRTNVNVTMAEGAIGLEEIIVVAYGTQSKKTLSGAISNVGSEAIVRTSSTNATGALVGKLQGITARAADARPGRGTTLQIRNMGNPLFVIDGIPYGGSFSTTSFGFTQGSGQDVFNNLAIEDIESVTVLKDAAAAIYGLRAANGVVLVTTKSGKNNEAVKINVNGYYGFQNFTRFPKPATAPQFVMGLIQTDQNLGKPISYTKEQYQKYLDGTEYGYKSYDYYDMVVRKNVPQSYINASASGGTQKATYYLSVSNIKQDAMLRDYTYNRSNIQANIDASLVKGLKIGSKMNAQITKSHNVGVPGLDDYWNPFYSIFNMWPTESPYANDNPQYIQQTHNVNVNPATYKDDVTGWVEEYWRSFNVNLYAQYTFNFGLTAKATASYNYMNEDFDGMEYTWNAYKYNAKDLYYTQTGWGNQNPWRERHKRNVFSRFAQLQLNYNKTFGDHTIAAVAAYERSDMENAYFVVHTVPSNNYVQLQQFSEQDYLSDEWGTEARAGYIGRFNYSYKTKYLLEALARYDGSYLYAPSKRWGLFPALSIGWRISEEDFFKNALGNIFQDLKIRASYGETGSESGVSAWGYLPGYNFGSGSAVLDGNYVLGLAPRGLPVTNLTWVKNRSKNIGIDFTLLQGKLTGQIDLFDRKRTGLPAARYDVLLPSEVGYSLPNENLNTDAQRGVEGILTYSSKAGNFSYAIGVNATLARSRNLETYKPRFGNSWDKYRNPNENNQPSENRWASINWGYKVIGQFQSMDEVINYPINNDGQGNRTQLPGDLKFQDTNGDKIINSLDNVPIGYAEGANPYMAFGLNGNAGWKGLSLAFDFAGATMQSYRRQYEGQIPYQSNGAGPWYLIADVWHQADPWDNNSPWIAGTYPAVRSTNTSHINFQKSSFWVTNVTYMRLKNIEVGYSLPKSILAKLGGIANFRVYVNGSNLFSLDNMRKFEIDPEVSSTSALVYPQAKLINTGFNITF